MIRSSSRARTTERGFILLAAIVLAVLYFGLMELLLLDSARELNEAQRFRARIVAAALAENAAELAMENAAGTIRRPINEEIAQGTMIALMEAPGTPPAARKFTIKAEGVTKGVPPQRATVEVRGEINGGDIRIDYTFHSQ